MAALTPPNCLPTSDRTGGHLPPCYSDRKKHETGCLLYEDPFFSFFSWNTFYFYYKYSSVVTKQSICHEGTVKHKECSAHKTGFVHNMWSGMLIIAGSETGRALMRLSPLISLFYKPGKQRWGQRSKPLVSASSWIRLIGSLGPHFHNPSHQNTLLYFPRTITFHVSLFIILACYPLLSWRVGIEIMVICSLHESN